MATMTDVQVEAARIPDRDRLLEMLREQGVEAEAAGELGVSVPVGSSRHLADDEDDVFARVEDVVIDLAGIFVPIEHEGVIYIRPPAS
jgi:hypothetical protein